MGVEGRGCGARDAPRPPAGIPATVALLDAIARSGVTDPEVLRALRVVPRDRFVPRGLAAHAGEDRPLPIGWAQTISQPSVVALMTEALRVSPGAKVLEVGTGSGYQTAVLAEVGAEVFSVEILPAVAELGRTNLEAAGYRDRIRLRVGDGYRGWPEEAPFDRILLTAAPDHVPAPLLEQLAPGGVLVLPVGAEGHQVVRRVTKGPAGVRAEDLLPVAFVPMTGEARR